eukprot:c1241_g1_i1.p1 GENE.c1241_g1_i1~~c1241_g1_i1.p1  ORF type:complete len:431 (-),score=107.59 c1241_g1_i1:85-1377(-)
MKGTTMLLLCFLALCVASVNSVCLNNCSGRGICTADATSGDDKCVCYDGFGGLACDSSTTGCPNFCSGHGTCLDGMCDCEVGYTALDCSIASSACAAYMNCTGHGQCVSGACVCDVDWDGESCSVYKGKPCPAELHDCTNRGECGQWTDSSSSATTSSNSDVAWTCRCDSGFCGSTCSIVCPTCPGNCSGHGVCADSSCTCHEGFRGSDCSEVAPIPGCPNFCSLHGVCEDGTCKCTSGYVGDDCGTIDPLDEKCPNLCSYHGSCGSGGVCVCDSDWTGVSCNELRQCPGNCTGKGLCDHGSCVCYSGAAGSECQYVCPTGGSDKGCSGSGNCVEKNGMGSCVCDSGHFGDACEFSSVSSMEVLAGGSPIGIVLVALGAVLFAVLIGGFVYNYAQGKRGMTAIPGYTFVREQINPSPDLPDAGYASIGDK